MKKILISITIILLTLSSCENFLTVVPDDSRVADNFYTSEEALRSNTASLYSQPWFDFHNRFMWLAGDQMAGDIYYTYDQEGHYFFNKVGAGNTYSNSGWVGLYRVISYANSIINDMPLPASANGIPEQAINKALAEARFVRASAYMYLTEYWGEVPIIENSTALITSGDPNAIYVNKHKQENLYRFMCEDLEFAAEYLPETDQQKGRVTKWSALGLLSKIYLTRATFENRSEYYAKAKELAATVIETSGLTLATNYADLFTVEGNNNPESLFAIQCMTGTWGSGNARNANWSRSARIADQQWGGGLGPTLSLQNTYSSDDLRQKSVFMTQGNYYSELDKANGGYTYQYSYRDPSDLDNQVESPNEVLAHMKKYCIGKAADNGNNVGLAQDGANNIYILRLADVYLVYVEAVMAGANSTGDNKALEYFNAIRSRAGLADHTGEITWADLLAERRKEFGLEGINWFDVKRYYYRDPQGAIDYLTNMERDRIYRIDYSAGYSDMSTAEKYEFENNKKNYILSWHTIENPENPDPDGNDRVDIILFTKESMTLAIPTEVTTKAPILLKPAIDYYAQ